MLKCNPTAIELSFRKFLRVSVSVQELPCMRPSFRNKSWWKRSEIEVEVKTTSPNLGRAQKLRTFSHSCDMLPELCHAPLDKDICGHATGGQQTTDQRSKETAAILADLVCRLIQEQTIAIFKLLVWQQLTHSVSGAASASRRATLKLGDKMIAGCGDRSTLQFTKSSPSFPLSPHPSWPHLLRPCRLPRCRW